MVTLLGPPGIGKTRLALELCERYSEARFCDLSDVSDASSLAAALAHALEVPLTIGDDVEEALHTLGRALSARGRSLLVLDNAEHLIEEARLAVGLLRREAARARLLVTSRQRLAIEGEHAFDLAPLSLPSENAAEDEALGSEAVKLFIDRARAVRHGYQPKDDELRALVELVRELDGLPLAIELCAARARVLSAREMRAQVVRPFELMRGTGVARSLWSAIATSWELLSAPERATLVQCSVFHGSFDAAAAEAVVDGAMLEGRGVLETIEELVDRSLIRTIDPGGYAPERRFTLLSSVREFAADQLGAEATATKLRHARYYARQGRRWARLTVERDTAVAHERVRIESQNFLAAHRNMLASSHEAAGTLIVDAALSLVPLYWREGPLQLCQELLEQALAHAGDTLTPATEATARAARAGTLRLLGRAADGLHDALRALSLAESADRGRLLGVVLGELGYIYLDCGAWNEAKAAFERALDLHRGDPVMEARALYGLGAMHASVDELDKALRCFEQGLASLRGSGDRTYEGIVMSWLAAMEMEKGYLRARDHFAAALEIHDETGNRRMRAWTLGYFGVFEQDQSRLDEARALYEQAIGECVEVGNRRHEGTFRGYLGSCCLERGEVAEALAHLEAAVTSLTEAAVPASRALFRAFLAVAHAERDDLRAAEDAFQAAEADLATTTGQRFFTHALLLHRGHLELARARRTTSDVEAAQLRRAARARLEEAPPRAQSDMRFAARMLERALGRAGIAPPARASVDMLLVDAQGAWFRPPGGTRIPLGQRRQALRGLLIELARARIAAPGEPVPSERLIGAGWPEEKIAPAAAQNRLRVALHTLRKMGLSGVLERTERGYYFSTDAELRLVDDD